MYYYSLFIIIIACITTGQTFAGNTNPDWLIYPDRYTSYVTINDDQSSVDIGNGLLNRRITIKPNAATVSLKHLISREEFVRSIRPEAAVEIDGMKFDIGGLTGQAVHNYILPQWLDSLAVDPASFKFTQYSRGPIKKQFSWKKRMNWLPKDLPWPPAGKSFTLHFKADQETITSIHAGEVSKNKANLEYLTGISIDVIYEIYDGLPLISKMMTIYNYSNQSIMINQFKNEILAVVEPESPVSVPKNWRLPNMTVETDYAFASGMSNESRLGKSVFWNTDPKYMTQVNYQRQSPYLLECRPQYGPAQELYPGIHWNPSGYSSCFMTTGIVKEKASPFDACTAPLHPG